MWLPWKYALCIAALCLVGWLATRTRSGKAGRLIAPLLLESMIVLIGYAAWMRVGEQVVMGPEDAAGRARWIWKVEQWLPIPTELTLQRWALPYRWLIRFANTYYIVAHVVPMGIYLVWLYVRHREAFARWRNQLAFLSIVGAFIQWIPVAPPRLLPDLGFVDTAARWGPRVYDNEGFKQPGQLAAMPSMHVGWAVLIAVAVFTVSRSRWRWIGPIHAALTIFAVTIPAYHWHLDGLVSVVIMLTGLAIAAGFRSWRGARLAPRLPVSESVAESGATLSAGP